MQDGIKTLAGTTTPYWKFTQPIVAAANQYTSWCLAIIRTSDNLLLGGGYPWSSLDSRIPSPPNTQCTINGGQPLDINMGTVEQSLISDQSTTSVVRNINISCNSDGKLVTADMDVSISYQPMINKLSAIQTTTPGLGVGIGINGGEIKPLEKIKIPIINGNSDINLNFSLIRDSAITSEAIQTGRFGAQAILMIEWL